MKTNRNFKNIPSLSLFLYTFVEREIYKLNVKQKRKILCEKQQQQKVQLKDRKRKKKKSYFILEKWVKKLKRRKHRRLHFRKNRITMKVVKSRGK
jgi:hypothetical protein